MGSSIESDEKDFTNVMLSAVSLYSALCQQVAVLAGLAAAGFFAATTQLDHWVDFFTGPSRAGARP